MPTSLLYHGWGVRGYFHRRTNWKSLRRSRAAIRAVATDMALAYTFAVSENIPDAVHVFDRFHGDLRRHVQHTSERLSSSG